MFRVSFPSMPTIGPLLARDLGSFTCEVPSNPIVRILCFVFSGHLPLVQSAGPDAPQILVLNGQVQSCLAPGVQWACDAPESSHLWFAGAESLSPLLVAPLCTVALHMYIHIYIYHTIYEKSCLYDVLTLTLWYPVPDRGRSANIGSSWPIGSCHRGSPVTTLKFSAIQPASQPPQLPLASAALSPCLIASLLASF